jgi:hypothetical protein
VREPSRVVGISSSTKADAVFLGGLRRVRVHDVVAPCNGLEQRTAVSEKIGGSLESRYERDEFISWHNLPTIDGDCAYCAA